jgi:hypothetical protein
MVDGLWLMVDDGRDSLAIPPGLAFPQGKVMCTDAQGLFEDAQRCGEDQEAQEATARD